VEEPSTSLLPKSFSPLDSQKLSIAREDSQVSPMRKKLRYEWNGFDGKSRQTNKQIDDIGGSMSDEEDSKYEFEKEYKLSDKYKAEKKKFINFRDFKGKTALHYAAARVNVKVVQLLVENGANLYIRDHKKRVMIA